MKNILTTAIFVAVLCFVQDASAGYLYWAVSGTETVKAGTSDPYKPGVYSTSDIQYTFARVKYTSESEWSDTVSSAATAFSNTSDGSATATYAEGDSFVSPTATTAAILDLNSKDYASGYFFIELYDASNAVVGHSELYSASTLQNFYNASAFNASWGAMNSFTPSPYSVPEPTSGLLLVVGAALLGLRRKRVA